MHLGAVARDCKFSAEKNRRSLAPGLPAGGRTTLLAMPPRYLPPRTPPQAPDPLDFGRAMAQHSTLSQLGRRLAASQRHLAVVSVALPGAMKRFVQAGTLDEHGWTLVADNAAIAAKLRHLQPQLLRLLQEEGLLLEGELRIRVRQS